MELFREIVWPLNSGRLQWFGVPNIPMHRQPTHSHNMEYANGINIHAKIAVRQIEMLPPPLLLLLPPHTENARKLKTLNVYSKIELMGFPHRRAAVRWYVRTRGWVGKVSHKAFVAAIDLKIAFFTFFLDATDRCPHPRGINSVVCLRSLYCLLRTKHRKSSSVSQSPQLFRLSFDRFVEMEPDAVAMNI